MENVNSEGQNIEGKVVLSYLKKSRLFEHLSEKDLDVLVPLSKLSSFKSGSKLITEGEAGNDVFFLLGGRLRVYSGGEPIIELKRKGDIIGEMSVISNKPCSATVKAVGETKVFRIKAQEIGAYTGKNTQQLQNVMYRIFAMVMTDKLTMTTDKAKKYERERRQIREARANLKTARQMLDDHALQLAEAKNKAEAANQAKSDFLANVSHELRNPMHQVLSYSRNGISKIDRPKEKLLFYFSQIKKSADRLMVFLNDLLDLSKMEAGKMDYTMLQHDLWQVVKGVTEEFKSSLQEKAVEMLLMEPTVPCRLVCDEFRIEQVIRNLLSNALKYTPNHRQIKVFIEHSSVPKGRRSSDKDTVPALILSVRDEGVGIPEDELVSVFDKFVQSSNTSTGAGGTGLGLAICKEIMDAHHGRIWAESNVEGGVTFCILLPLEPAVVKG